MVTGFSFLTMDTHRRSRNSLVSYQEHRRWLLSMLDLFLHVLLAALPLCSMCKIRSNRYRLTTTNKQAFYYMYITTITQARTVPSVSTQNIQVSCVKVLLWRVGTKLLLLAESKKLDLLSIVKRDTIPLWILEQQWHCVQSHDEEITTFKAL